MLKQPYQLYHQTGWSSIHSNQNYDDKTSKIQKSTNYHQNFIMQKLKACQKQQLNYQGIQKRMKTVNQAWNLLNTQAKKHNYPKAQQIHISDHQQATKIKQAKQLNQDKFNQKTMNNHQSHKEYVLVGSTDKNDIKKTYLTPTQSWKNNHTPQKQSSNSKKIPTKIKQRLYNQELKSPQRLPHSKISIHEQLYLQSRKKQLKRSAQQIIEHQYFKKQHPFTPQIGGISNFLAQQKFEKIKLREEFESEFNIFEESTVSSNSALINSRSKQSKNDYLDIQIINQEKKHQTQLKNYQILKDFFLFLTQGQHLLTFSHINSKHIYQLPTALLKVLQPILQDFCMNRNKKQADWLRFLSDFNLKVKNKKSFFLITEKWFSLKFSIKYAKQNKIDYHQTKSNCHQSIISKQQDQSTYINQSNDSHVKEKRSLIRKNR